MRSSCDAPVRQETGKSGRIEGVKDNEFRRRAQLAFALSLSARARSASKLAMACSWVFPYAANRPFQAAHPPTIGSTSVFRSGCSRHKGTLIRKGSEEPLGKSRSGFSPGHRASDPYRQSRVWRSKGRG